MKETTKKFFLSLLTALVSGIFIGVIVGVYQLLLQYVVEFSTYMYTSSAWYLLLLMFILVMLAAAINYLIISRHRGVEGSGIPVLEVGVEGLMDIDYKYDIPLLILNSSLSTFAGFPLGSEGPSVVIGGKTGKLVNDIFRVDDKDNILMAAGCGFGAAFLSPLAGLAYMFEENLHKINIKLFLRGIVMMVPAFIVTSLINHHHLLSISNAEIISFNYYFVFIFLFMIDIIIALAFVKGLIFCVQMFGKYKNKKIIKYRGVIFFVLIFIMSIFLFKLMGSGLQIINNIYSYSGVFLLFGILLLRYLLTVLTGSGKVTGGLVIPLMALGAIGGMIICEISSLLFNLNQEFFPVIVLISMTSTFSYVTMTPLTSTLLAYSALGYSFSNYLYPLQLIPVLLILNYGGYFLLKYLLKHQCIYPQMCHLIIDDYHSNDKVEKMK